MGLIEESYRIEKAISNEVDRYNLWGIVAMIDSGLGKSGCRALSLFLFPREGLSEFQYEKNLFRGVNLLEPDRLQ